MQELEMKLDAATANRDQLRRKLDRRLEIIEELKQKVVDLYTCRRIDLRHQVPETKAEAEREIQTMKRTHETKWR
jgi:hypothetical protein